MPPQFDRNKPFNSLAPLPPMVEIESNKILKACIRANRVLAELKGLAKLIPNQGILIDSLVLQEARLSSEIENIVTTNDELFMAAADENDSASPEAKEVLRYRQALKYGFSQIYQGRPLSTNLFVEMARLIKQQEFGIRRLPGTRIANSRRETVYTPPEGETLIRDKLKELEAFIHSDSQIDCLIKMALIHYQFEAIHPFTDGNGRTGRIINVLFLVSEKMLNIPVLYLSRFIIDHKKDYYEGLRRVTEEGAWEDWILYILAAIEDTSLKTQQRIQRIHELMNSVATQVKGEAPLIYSKDLIEAVFRHPYCKIQFLEQEGLGTRQTCAKYLRELQKMHLLRPIKKGNQIYWINDQLCKLLIN